MVMASNARGGCIASYATKSNAAPACQPAATPAYWDRFQVVAYFCCSTVFKGRPSGARSEIAAPCLLDPIYKKVAEAQRWQPVVREFRALKPIQMFIDENFVQLRKGKCPQTVTGNTLVASFSFHHFSKRGTEKPEVTEKISLGA